MGRRRKHPTDEPTHQPLQPLPQLPTALAIPSQRMETMEACLHLRPLLLRVAAQPLGPYARRPLPGPPKGPSPGNGAAFCGSTGNAPPLSLQAPGTPAPPAAATWPHTANSEDKRNNAPCSPPDILCAPQLFSCPDHQHEPAPGLVQRASKRLTDGCASCAAPAFAPTGVPTPSAAAAAATTC